MRIGFAEVHVARKPFGLSLSTPWRAGLKGVLCLRAGAGLSPRQATHFLLLRQKKVSKEKATRSLGPCAYAPGTLRCSKGTEILETCLLRSLRTSKIFNPSPPALLSPARTGLGEGRPIQRQTSTRHGAYLWSWAVGLFGCWYPSPPPFCMRRGAEGKADQGSRLSERSEFERDPAFGEHRRLPGAKRKDPDHRVAFLFLRFLWRSKET